jgi:AraC-like DNA-binding protein
MAVVGHSTSAFSEKKAYHWREYLESEVGWSADFSGYDEETFEARLEYIKYGPFCLRNNWTAPVVAVRRDAGVASLKERYFLLCVHLEGQVLMSQNGTVNRLGAGDIMFTDNTATGQIHCEKPTNTLGLHVPWSVLSHYFPNPERLCNLPLCSDMPYAHAVREMARGMWREGCNGMDEAQGVKSANLLLDLATTAFAMAYRCDAAESAVASSRLFSVKQYIERELCNSELTPTAIAESLGISQRYIRKLFSMEDDSAMKYIQRRRLEKCASQLASPVWRGHTISDIAFSWGFNSSAHFTRAFRAQFGCSPKEYRGRRPDHQI